MPRSRKPPAKPRSRKPPAKPRSRKPPAKPRSRKPAAKPRSRKPAAKPAPTRRTDPALWREVQQKWLRGSKGGVAGKWNARKAMLAVQEYKRRGGRYVGPRPRGNSLAKWQKEDWGYVDGDAAGRYLPRRVRESLTAAEKRAENRQKRGRRGEWVPYTASVNEKMRKAGVY